MTEGPLFRGLPPCRDLAYVFGCGIGLLTNVL